MTTPWKQRLGIGLRWLAIVAVFLATSELLTRVEAGITWGAPLFGPYTHDRLMARDSAGVHGRPGYRFEKWRMNNLGFRGADISEVPKPGTTRVVVLGASETFGLFESEGREYPARMQFVLDSLAPGRFEVINAALPGMKLSSMVPYYQSAVAHLRPQYVVIYPTPSFYLFVTEPKPVSVGQAETPLAPDQGREREFETAGFSSRLAPNAREVVKGLVPPVLLNAYREWRLEQIYASHPADWLWKAVPAGRMSAFGQDLEQLIGVVRATGAEPVLVTHTNFFVGCPVCVAGKDRRHAISLMLKDYPRASAHVMVAVDSAAREGVRALARRVGTPVVEAEGRIPPGATYFADYDHFTDAGADVMARLLASAILRMQSGKDKP